MAEKVKITSYSNGMLNLYIPELRVNRFFEKNGQSFLFDKDAVEEMFYYPAVENLFKKGILYIEDKEIRKKFGLEEENGSVSEDVVAPISNATILAYLNVKPFNEFKEYVSKLPLIQQERFVSIAIEKKILDYNKINLLKELTGKDIIKIIQLNEEE
jgi:hypothetical protein